MTDGFRFPSQLWVLMNDEDVPVNLIFVTDYGAWAREDGEWVEFLVDDNNPKRRFEGMGIAPVDPRIIDVWDIGNVSESDVEEFEYKWAPSESTTEPETVAEPVPNEEPLAPEEAVTAGGFGFIDTGLPAALKRQVADTIWAYHHAQGYHWNVKGPQFAEYHALFLTIYEDYLASIDPSAENLLKIGSEAPYTQEDLQGYRTIPDVPSAETPRDMASALLAVNEALAQSTKSAFDAANEADNQGIANFLAGRLDVLDKWSWQLRSSIKGGGSIMDEPLMASGYDAMMDNDLPESLKEQVADTIWAYHHAQGYHWNVKGAQFSEYHALFLTIYEDYLASIDPSAENLLKIGSTAPYTEADLAEYRTIPDVPAGETPRDMAAALLAINEALTESTKRAFDAATDADNQGIADFLAGRLDVLDKWSWQLRSSIA